MYIDPEFVINNEQYQVIQNFCICGICKGIVYDPVHCQVCENNFCRKCIEEWNKNSMECPFKCEGSSFKDSRMMKNMLSILKFKCEKGCPIEIKYDELMNHYEFQCEKIDFQKRYQELQKDLEKLENEEKENEKALELLENKLLVNKSIDYSIQVTKHPRYKRDRFLFRNSFEHSNVSEPSQPSENSMNNSNLEQNEISVDEID